MSYGDPHAMTVAANGAWVDSIPGHFLCTQCGQYAPIVSDVPHQCRTGNFITTTGVSTYTWAYTCTACGQLVTGWSGSPPHICPGAAAASDGPEECGLCFSLVRRGKMSVHWMNLHHTPQPG